MPVTITLYESALCGYCRAAKRLLDSKDWPYEAISVDGKPEVFQQMQERSGRNTVPQIYFGDTHVGGFDDMAELESRGELDALYES